MNGNKDPDDVALLDGDSYFVEWSGFEAYLGEASKNPEEVSRLSCYLSDSDSDVLLIGYNVQPAEGRHYAECGEIQKQGHQWRLCSPMCTSPVL